MLLTIDLIVDNKSHFVYVLTCRPSQIHGKFCLGIIPKISEKIQQNNTFFSDKNYMYTRAWR